MKKRNLHLLFHLSKHTELNKSLNTSTSKLAKQLDISQQSVSRKLRELQNSNIIQRTVTNDGITIKLTDQGKQILKQYYINLKNLFEKQTKLKGKVSSGLGEGAFYMKQPNYKNQLKKILKFTPFEGTLNLKTKENQTESFLINKPKTKINGFKTKERTFGSLICYNITINNTNAALIIPERTNYSLDTVEIIAENKLRKELNIEDGDEVIIK